MLVLTRKIEEEIRIGNNITIKVLGIRGGSVRLGIAAPADLKILRKELEPLPAVEIEESALQQNASCEGLSTRPNVTSSRLRISNTGRESGRRPTLSLLAAKNGRKLHITESGLTSEACREHA